MAKTTGPLMSMDASGAFGGTLVFTRWKGRKVVRQLVTPANPMTLDQVNSRNRIRVGGAIQHHVNVDATKSDSSSLTDEQRIAAITPAGYAWNGFLIDTLIGSGALSYDAAQAAWAALQAAEKTAWNNAAEGLAPAYTPVAQFGAGNAAATALTAGNVFFLHRYAMSLMGIAATPGAVPPVYA